MEALLSKSAKEKAGKSTVCKGITQRCIYNNGGIRCSKRCLPLTKYCSRHICFDSDQVLFRKCSFISNSQNPCTHSVSLISNTTTCPLHTEPIIKGKVNHLNDNDVISTNNSLGNINTEHYNNDIEQDEIVVDDV